MPNVLIYADPSDNQILSSNAAYASAREGTGTLTLGDPAGTTFQVGQGVPGNFECYQSFLAFDTSAFLGTVDSIELGLDVFDDQSQTQFTCEARLLDWGTAVETTDYVPGSGLGALPLLATMSSAGLGPAMNWFTDVDFATYLNIAGQTRIILASDRHRLGTQPTQSESLVFNSADASGTTSDPQLSVFFTPPPPTPLFFG